ncbi:MAG: hypothetical protein ACI4YB_11015 [Oscillospiraceae bacterium]
MQFSRLFKAITVLLAILSFVFFVLYRTYHTVPLFSLTITAATMFYHFVMRLAVGTAVDALTKNGINFESRWFREKKFEKKLYKLLKVKKWKHIIPTWEPQKFSLEHNEIKKIIENMCAAEIIHEMIILLGYVSLLFSLFTPDPKENLLIFVITAFFAGCCDAFFVILQRYNRLRIVKIYNKSINMTEKVTL